MSEGSVTEGGDGAASRLERRARNLLRAYPPAYRADRGEEIIGTLLEATPPGRSWPSARDTVSILCGGIRARRIANQRQDIAASLRQAAMLGIALYLISSVMMTLLSLYLSFVFPLGGQIPAGWKTLLPFLLLVAVLAAAWSGRRRLTAVTAVAGGAAYLYSSTSWDEGGWTSALRDEHVTVPLLALAALVLLTRSAERTPRSWLWFPGIAMGTATVIVLNDLRIPPAASMLRWLGGDPFLTPWTYSSVHAFEITFALCLCWAVTDVRPLAGLALGYELLSFGTDLSFFYGHIQFDLLELSMTTIPLAVVFALAVLLRSRLRASPPTAG